MATIGEKQQVLGGRGIVRSWDEGTSAVKYFCRERVTEDDKRKYKYRILEGIITLSEATEKAPEAACYGSGAPSKAQLRASSNPLEGLEASTRVNAQLLERIKQSKASGIPIEEATKGFSSNFF
ncbi:hypothetical protein OAE71_00025 [Synechococcus sp. AH-551-A21]|nr:hypothetical protein [Synechococcus sp. AH-551-A21]MDB4677531.1 hypothetical protein [Synechococcus sp. AH-551-A21]